MAVSFPLPEEPRPRDFSARIRRSRARSLARSQRKRPGSREALVLLGAVALPAFAAPQDWQRFEIGNAGQAEASIEPMPFEKAGASFPGSAFYYLAADDVSGAALGEGIHSDAQGAPAPFSQGSVAKAIRIRDSGLDLSRAQQCLTAAIYYEAASEPDSGQRAVAQVVLNRVAQKTYPNTVCGVVYQGSERSTGCQFTFTCDGSLARKPSRLFWKRAESVARAALAGYVYAPVGLATHYHTIQVHPYWADKLSYRGTIGAHRFYSFQGRAGSADIFRFAYRGGEPLPAPHARSASAKADMASGAADPVLVQRTFEENAISAAARPALAGSVNTAAAPAPNYTQRLRDRGGDALYRAEKLPESSGIRPEYENSGRWIAQPGT